MVILESICKIMPNKLIRCCTGMDVEDRTNLKPAYGVI
jgi:hypothetical protein